MSKHKFKKPATHEVVTAKKSKTFYAKSEEWLNKKQHFIIGLLVTIAIIIRIVYFIQLNSGPCIWQHRYQETDMNFYDEWAKIITHGNWLSDTSFHQYDAAHQWIADYYFKTHPDESVQMQQQLGTDKSPEALGRLLWQRWDGGKIFHQDPLYIYIVAIVYKIFGEDVRYVFVLQMLIGIFSILLIYFITRKYFGNTAAFFSGFLAVFCGPVLFYELVLVRESIIVFAGLLLVFMMDKAFENPSPKSFFILGITIAFSILLKSTFSLFLLLTIGLSFIVFRKQFNLFIKYTAVLLAGVLLIYSPLLIRNSIVGVPVFTQNAIGSISVIASNDVNYNPEESYELNLKNTTEIIDKTGGKTIPSFLLSMQTHPDALSYLTLLTKKLALVFHWYEFPNNKNFYYYRLHSSVLWCTFVNLLIILPLGLVGLMVSIIQKKKLWSLYLLLLMHLMLLVVFLVLSRYRIPLEAAMIPFAGFALSELLKNYQSNIKYVIVMLAVVIATAFFLGRALPEKITFIRGVDYQQPYNFYYKQIIEEDLKRGDAAGALKTMSAFMALEPDDVKKLSPASSLNNYEIVLARVYAEFHLIFANLYERNGDIDQAKSERERADELHLLDIMNDNSGSIESLLARAAAAPADQQQKLYSELVAPLWNEVKLNPNNLGFYQSLNETYLKLNLPDSSIFVLQQLLKVHENDFYATFQLGTIFGRYKNDMANAVYYLEKARLIDPKSEDVYLNLGVVYVMLQQNEKAIEMMQMTRKLNPKNRDNLQNLELLLRKLNRNAEADEVKKSL